MTVAGRIAHAKWRGIWEEMVLLKKSYAPDTVPLDLWLPMEEACKQAAMEMQRCR